MPAHYVYKHDFKFSKGTFSYHDLPDLLLNIWSYSNAYGECLVCTQYSRWCAELAREKWLPQYLNFDKFIRRVSTGDKKLPIFGRTSTAEKNCIFQILKKKASMTRLFFSFFFFLVLLY